MKHSHTTRPEVTPSNAPLGAPTQGMMEIDGAYLRRLMLKENLDITSPELARATGVDPSYVRQVRTGRRPRVSRAFMRAAEIYVGDRIGWRGVPAGILLAKEQ